MLAESHDQLMTDRAGPDRADWNARPSFQIAQAADTVGGLDSNGIDNLPPAGRVAALTGEAVILRADGGREPAAAGIILHQGDVVLAGQGASVLIARPDGAVQPLGGGERLTVAAPPRRAADPQSAGPEGQDAGGETLREQPAPEETAPQGAASETPAGEGAAEPDPAGTAPEIAFIPTVETGLRPWTGLWQAAEGQARVADLTVGDGGGASAHGTTADDDAPASRGLSGASAHSAPPPPPDPPSQDLSPAANPYQAVINPYQTESFPLSNVRKSNDWIVGGGGNDTRNSNPGPEKYNGGDGRDTLIYQGPITDYRFGFDADGRFTVTDANPADGNEGVDTLVNVEVLRFAGVDYALAVQTAADGGQTFTLSAPGHETVESPDPTVAEYTGPLADYVFGYDAAGRLTVTDNTPGNGNDSGVVSSAVETLRFPDGEYNLLTGPVGRGTVDNDLFVLPANGVAFGGLGDDVFHNALVPGTFIGGGGGIDTAVITGPGARLDIRSGVDDLEAVQLTGSHLTVTPAGVQGATTGQPNPLTGLDYSLVIYGRGRVDLEADIFGTSFTRPAGNPIHDLDPDGDGTATTFSVYQAQINGGGPVVSLYIEEGITMV